MLNSLPVALREFPLTAPSSSVCYHCITRYHITYMVQRMAAIKCVHANVWEGTVEGLAKWNIWAEWVTRNHRGPGRRWGCKHTQSKMGRARPFMKGSKSRNPVSSCPLPCALLSSIEPLPGSYKTLHKLHVNLIYCSCSFRTQDIWVHRLLTLPGTSMEGNVKIFNEFRIDFPCISYKLLKIFRSFSREIYLKITCAARDR